MKVKKFVFKNFKGIKSTEIDIDAGPPGKIVTLIGLNESGKTTILEAISSFFMEDPDTKSLVATIQSREPIDALVPKSKKGIFNGKRSSGDSILNSQFQFRDTIPNSMRDRRSDGREPLRRRTL